MHIFSSTPFLLAGLVATLDITGIGALPVQNTEVCILVHHRALLHSNFILFYYQPFSLYRRSLQHPGPKDHSFLFHGTTARWEGQVKRKVLLKETSNIGDLHCNRDAGKGGEFTFTHFSLLRCFNFLRCASKIAMEDFT